MKNFVILCPYCMSEVSENEEYCKTCGDNITNDAPFEMTLAEMNKEPRKKCKICGAEMFSLAIKCPKCKQKQ